MKENAVPQGRSELDTFLMRIALKDAKVETGGATPTTISGDTLAELARKHQVAENVITRLGGFMDAEALRAIADGVVLNLDTVPDAEASAVALQAIGGCLNFCVRGALQTCPRRRASLATNARRGGQVGASYAVVLVNRSS